jgi:5-hydroxyisourate hydrolase-like protein (transthyretin family)
MRVDITPRRLTAPPGTPVVFTVTVTNTSDVISGHSIRVLGVDPRWVSISEERLSLFPGSVGSAVITLSLPPGIPAGQRRISVQVRQLTAPESATVIDVDLDLPPVHGVEARIEPGSVTAGRRASFGMLVENAGNTTWTGDLVGSDEEDKLRFSFTPPKLRLAPGEHAAVEVNIKGRPRLLGSIAVRPVVLSLKSEHAPDDDAANASANATFLQTPILGRGALALAGLLVAVTVFALVITYALSGVVGRSAADRDLALQVAQAQQQGTSVGTSSASGTVHLLTSGSPVAGVTVEIFAASDTANPVTSTATDHDGAYSLSGLPDGSYKLRFRGAGFAELWYPQALTDADASTINLQPGQDKTGLDVRLGGLPASISGTITGGDPTGATVSLVLPGTGVSSNGGAVASTVTTTAANGTTIGDGATVQTVQVGGDGAFALANVPSPGVYDLAVAKPGFATQIERVDVAGGEQRTGLQIRLRQGDGVISGLVTTKAGPLGGATVSAQFDGTTLQTVALTEKGKEGQFTLRGLPTPGVFTVVVSAQGYASQTLSLSLAAQQQLSGVNITLGGSAGSLGGTVTLASDGSPAPGVTVTVTNGTLTVVTVTNSQHTAQGDVGQWSVGGLPLPSTYTVTFSRSDLAAQTLAVSLDPFGLVAGTASADSATSVNAALTSSTATLLGRTLQVDRNGNTQPVSEVSVSLTSGSATYQVTSASLPTSNTGAYEFDHLPPGTYTVTVSARGARPTSQIVPLVAGQRQPLDLTLAAPASIHGTVYDVNGKPVPHAEVRLYLTTQYPNTSVATVEADAGGGYSFDNLDAPQNYVVEYDYPAGSAPRASSTVTLQESTSLQVDLRPDPGSGP